MQRNSTYLPFGFTLVTAIGMASASSAMASTAPCDDPDIQVTAPSTLGVADGTWTMDGVTTDAKNPLAEALKNADPGDRILMGPGQYLGIQLGKTGWSHYHVPDVTDVDVCGTSADEVEIVPPFGPGSVGHSIYVTDQAPVSDIRFWDLSLTEFGTAGVLIGGDPDTVFSGFEFHGVVIDGGYDWETQTGNNSKWGVLTNGVEDFRFQNGVVRNIHREHSFYLHNNQGDVFITGNDLSRVGRTFLQVTGRPGEGPMGKGRMVFRGNTMTDCALADGGSCITIAGHRGKTIIKNNVLEMGLDDSLDRCGFNTCSTGAIVAWTPEKDAWPGLKQQNGEIDVVGNIFVVQDGDRSIASFATTEQLTIRDTLFESPSTIEGKGEKRIVFDPYSDSGPESAGLNNYRDIEVCENTLIDIADVICMEGDCPFRMEEECR